MAGAVARLLCRRVASPGGFFGLPLARLDVVTERVRTGSLAIVVLIRLAMCRLQFGLLSVGPQADQATEKRIVKGILKSKLEKVFAAAVYMSQSPSPPKLLSWGG